MTDILRATWALYQHAFRATTKSFLRCWIICLAVVCFAAAMVLATTLAAPLGLLGGFLLGAVNALLIGAMLGLVEDAIAGARRLWFPDIWSSLGRYFWDVISVGFILWVPMMLLEQGLGANPNGPLIAAAVLLLLFILLNAVPEVIYQVRHDSPLDVLRESYLFVVDNWIEWFLPLALVLAPFGLSFFFGLSGRLGRGAGLDFFQILVLPFTVLAAWLSYAGLPDGVSSVLVLLLTPPAAVMALIFRGHLFAALHGTSRRQRLFRSRFGQDS